MFGINRQWGLAVVLLIIVIMTLFNSAFAEPKPQLTDLLNNNIRKNLSLQCYTPQPRPYTFLELINYYMVIGGGRGLDYERLNQLKI